MGLKEAAGRILLAAAFSTGPYGGDFTYQQPKAETIQNTWESNNCYPPPKVKQIYPKPNISIPRDISGHVLPQEKIKGLGWRNDIPDYMPMVSSLGASEVRIDFGKGELTWQRTKGVTSAIKENLGLFLVINPQKHVPKDELKETMSKVFSLVPKDYPLKINGGNEYDNLFIPFWPDRSAKTHVDFLIDLYDVMQELRPGTEIVVGSTVDPGNQKTLVDEMIARGINPNIFTWDVHVYTGAAELDMRVNSLKDAFALHGLEVEKIIIGEAGVNGYYLDTEKESVNIPQIEATFAHELSFDPHGERYGLLNRANGNVDKEYWQYKAELWGIYAGKYSIPAKRVEIVYQKVDYKNEPELNR